MLSSIQLPQDFKVSNGRPLIRKISVKRAVVFLKWRLKTSVTQWFSYIVLKYKENIELIFGRSSTLITISD